MKKNSTGLFSPIVDAEIFKLTTEVKEILATGISKHNCQVFSNADLWHIQRRQKARRHRRFI